MTTEPYASADRVFWITDNGSSHRGAESVQRMTRAWPNAHLIHLPLRASWLDQAEIYFSVVQRKVITPRRWPGYSQPVERGAGRSAHAWRACRARPRLVVFDDLGHFSIVTKVVPAISSLLQR